MTFQWTDFCKSLFVEAEWYHKGYTPSLHEYLSNAWISSSGPVLLLHTFFSEKYEAKQEMINFLEKNHDLVYHISLLIRLCNDLGTSAVIYLLFLKLLFFFTFIIYTTFFFQHYIRMFCFYRQNKKEVMPHLPSYATCKK